MSQQNAAARQRLWLVKRAAAVLVPKPFLVGTQLSNRLDAETRGKVMVAVHARVPMVTPEELAVPRYLEFVRELPTTESGKVQKYRLRERGVTERTWDREAAHDRRTRQADASKQSRP